MEEKDTTDHTAHGTVGWKERIDRCKADNCERKKRLTDALMGFIERVTDSEHTATKSELHALPRVADVCSRLL